MDRRGFGYVRRLPSKRYQPSYAGPDLKRHVGPMTFTTKADAEAWLATERKEVESGAWRPPDVRRAEATRTIPTETLRVRGPLAPPAPRRGRAAAAQHPDLRSCLNSRPRAEPGSHARQLILPRSDPGSPTATSNRTPNRSRSHSRGIGR